MSYLLDTNIVSETVKPNPSKNLITWLNSISSDSLYLSVLSLGEIRYGIERLANSKKKSGLIIWLENDLLAWFEDRILTVDTEVADKWGYISANANRTLPAVDSLIAATALRSNLKLVTRNTKDFYACDGLEVINPA